MAPCCNACCPRFGVIQPLALRLLAPPPLLPALYRLLAHTFVLLLVLLTSGGRVGAAAAEKLDLFARGALNTFRFVAVICCDRVDAWVCQDEIGTFPLPFTCFCPWGLSLPLVRGRGIYLGTELGNTSHSTEDISWEGRTCPLYYWNNGERACRTYPSHVKDPVDLLKSTINKWGVLLSETQREALMEVSRG